jgi:ATP-dependent DNA ligase
MVKRSVASFTDGTLSYDVDPVLNTCTCKKWKYQRVPVVNRTCKHLDSIRLQSSSPSITTYPEENIEDTYFQLVTHHIPTHLPANKYVYSIKYDGIRVRITGNTAITRGGMTIDLTQLALPFVDTRVEYDAELIYTDKPGHTNVMLELSANRIHALSVRVFDIIDTSVPFQERLTTLMEQVPLPYRVNHTSLRDRTHLSKVVQEVLTTGAEGVVVRSLEGYYEPGRRSRYNVFKVKRKL